MVIYPSINGKSGSSNNRIPHDYSFPPLWYPTPPRYPPELSSRASQSQLWRWWLMLAVVDRHEPQGAFPDSPSWQMNNIIISIILSGVNIFQVRNIVIIIMNKSFWIIWIIEGGIEKALKARESGSLMTREMPMPRLKKIHIKDGRPALPRTVGRGVPLPALQKWSKPRAGKLWGKIKALSFSFS